MKTGQMLLLSALLLVAISHAQKDVGEYLLMVKSNSSIACQPKYEDCVGSQPSDYCSIVKNAKQCATTGNVQIDGSVAICTDTEYQRALDVACMTEEQRQKLGKLINARRQLSSECQSVVSSCFGPLVIPISLKEFCNAIKEADACLLYYVSVRQSCKPKYEEIKALACGAQNIAQNIVQNITFLMLACVLSLISRDLLVK